MIELGPARECDMVLAFLQAEISSPRFSRWLVPILQANGLPADELIHRANPEDPQQNAIRRAVLQRLRGFGADSYLFNGFPSDVQWQFVQLEPSDYGRLKFANESNWIRLTAGSRRVTDLAMHVRSGGAPEDPAEHVKAIQKAWSTEQSLRGLHLFVRLHTSGLNGKQESKRFSDPLGAWLTGSFSEPGEFLMSDHHVDVDKVAKFLNVTPRRVQQLAKDG